MDPHAHDIGIAGDQHQPPGGFEHQQEVVGDYQSDPVPSMGEVCDGSAIADGNVDADPGAALPFGADTPLRDGVAADDVRADLVTAEVAAVLALIAYEYFERPLFGFPVVARLPTAASRVGTPAYREASRRYAEPESGGCKIIAFPVRPR